MKKAFSLILALWALSILSAAGQGTLVDQSTDVGTLNAGDHLFLINAAENDYLRFGISGDMGTFLGAANLATMRSQLNVEDGADVTDTANVTAAGALMDSEVISLAAIKDVILTSGLTISADWLAADRTKIDGIEALADVTDETNVTDALDGAVFVDLGIPAGADLILFQDASDSNIVKTATATALLGSATGATSTGAGLFTIAADSDNNETGMTADLLFDNNGGTTVGRIRWDEASTTFNLGYGAANHFSIFGATGKVGLGNLTPGAPLVIGPGTGTGDISNNPGGLSDDYALVSSGTALETASWNLSVNEGARISTAKFFLTDAVSGSGAWGHWLSWASGGSQPYVIGSAGNEWLRINTSGELGLGTNAPGHELDVQDAGATVIRSKSTASSAYTYVDSFTGFDAGYQFYENGVLLHQIFQDSSRDNDLSIYDQVNAQEILYYDRSVQRVGIGTNAPNHALDVESASAAVVRAKSTGGAAYFYVDTFTGSDGGLRFHDNGTLIYHIFQDSSTGNDFRLYDNAGAYNLFYYEAASKFLGVGTASPDKALHVEGAFKAADSSTSKALVFQAANVDSLIQFYNTDQSTVLWEFRDDGGVWELNRGANTNNAITVDSGNLVGIGTSAPNTELTIGDGTSATERLRLDSLTNPIILMENGSNEWRMWGSGTHFYLEPETVNGSFYFRSQGNSNVARWNTLDGSLRLGDGTSPTYRLDAYNSAGGDVLRAIAGASTSNPIAVIEGTSNITGTQPVALQLKDNQTSGSWTDGATWGALDFYSADASGNGVGVRAAIRSYTNTSGSTHGLKFFVDNSTTSSGLYEAMVLENSGRLELKGNSFTEAIKFTDAGSTGATEQDWIEVTVGGVTGYVRVFATK